TLILHARLIELFDELRVVDAGRVELLLVLDFVLVLALDQFLADRNLADVTAAHRLLELAIGDLAAALWQQKGLAERHHAQNRNPLSPTSAMTRSPSRNSPSSTRIASGSSTCR